MGKRPNIKGVYTDLDSIFDTRAPLIVALTGQGKYGINFKLDRYKYRLRDNFGTLSSKIFHYYYDRRTKDILKAAPETSVPYVIRDYFSDVMDTAQKDVEAILYVNAFPYVFTNEEIDNLTKILYKLIPNVTIKVINMPLREIEKQWVLENVGLFISYEAMKWLRLVTDGTGFYTGDMLKLKLYAPCLLTGTIENKDLSEERLKSLELLYRTICDFSFLDVGVFSVI